MRVISVISACICSPVCLCSSSHRSGRVFPVRLIIVHGKLNCCDKLVQRQGASNDSLPPLIGLCLNQQLRGDFLFPLIAQPLKQSSTGHRSLTLLLHPRGFHSPAKCTSFVLLCAAYCVEARYP